MGGKPAPVFCFSAEKLLDIAEILWYSSIHFESEIGQKGGNHMDAKETQLQYKHLYKEMDASYYAHTCAQQLLPSEMDI